MICAVFGELIGADQRNAATTNQRFHLPTRLQNSNKTEEGVSDVINQASPTSCIPVPMYEATDAIHNARKSDTRSGPQADVACGHLPAEVPRPT
jgi:hypothetical protein